MRWLLTVSMHFLNVYSALYNARCLAELGVSIVGEVRRCWMFSAAKPSILAIDAVEEQQCFIATCTFVLV